MTSLIRNWRIKDAQWTLFECFVCLFLFFYLLNTKVAYKKWLFPTTFFIHAAATGLTHDFTPLQQLTGLACDFCSKDAFALLVTGRSSGFRGRWDSWMLISCLQCSTSCHLSALSKLFSCTAAWFCVKPVCFTFLEISWGEELLSKASISL